MGGCRCSYRTCKQSSDGRTHFFHYPVFDKIRCQQWIVNARRNDLLNLKLSQLKNRVICQHHFAENMFMNFKKEKLIHNAVPTEDGPFLEKEPKESTVEVMKIEEVSVDDSRFFTPREKMATFSVPYNQFLRECSFDMINDPGLRKSLGSPKKKARGTPVIIPTPENNENAQNNVNKETSPRPEPRRAPKRNKNVIILSEKTITEPIPVKPTAVQKAPVVVLKPPKKQVKPVTKNVSSPIPQTVEITIRHEENDPQYILGQDSGVMCPGDHPVELVQQASQTTSGVNNLLPQIVSVGTTKIDNSRLLHPATIPIEFVPGTPLESLPTGPISIVTLDSVGIESCPTNSRLEERPVPQCTLNSVQMSDKKSLTNRRTEKICEDRPFVHKLVPENVQTKSDKNSTKQSMEEISDDRPVVHKPLSHLKHHRSSSSISKSRHSCKGPRKMSSLSAALLAKTNENSRDIAEIKNLLLQQHRNQSVVKHVQDKSVGQDVAARKKYLYDELSQYLSTKLKNDLFEELFINCSKRKRI